MVAGTGVGVGFGTADGDGFGGEAGGELGDPTEAYLTNNLFSSS